MYIYLHICICIDIYVSVWSQEASPPPHVPHESSSAPPSTSPEVVRYEHHDKPDIP